MYVFTERRFLSGVIAANAMHPSSLRSFTSENLPRRDYPDGFQGNEIPIDGKAVAETCLEILQARDQ